MYFETVLSYLATFINDISLMNFSNHLTDLLYMLQSVIDCFSLFCFVIKLRLVTPVFVGTAKVEIFLLLSSFI